MDAEAEDLIQEARKRATCIYIAVEKPVADDIATVFLACADEIARLRQRVKELEQFKAWAEPQITDRGELLSTLEAVRQRVKELEEAYDSAAHHADRGWEFLKTAVVALHQIVSAGQTEWCSRDIAIKALWELPSAGAYEGSGNIPEPP